MTKVDFFIAGVQKGGTTALDRYLRAHTAIQMATVKEVHFFDNEDLDWSDPAYERLHSAFDWSVPGVLRGEATPIYIYWPNALERLRRYNEAAKIIIGLRHPSFRAYSHWRMETKRGSESLPFSAAIRWPARKRVADAPNGAHRVFSYVERGFYAPQIDRLLKFFPRDQVLFFRTDKLWAEQQSTLAKIQDFLGVDRTRMPNSSYIVPLQTWDPLGIPKDDRTYLDKLYADDIRRTTELAQLTLDDWLAHEYEEYIAPDAAM